MLKRLVNWIRHNPVWVSVIVGVIAILIPLVSPLLKSEGLHLTAHAEQEEFVVPRESAVDITQEHLVWATQHVLPEGANSDSVAKYISKTLTPVYMEEVISAMGAYKSHWRFTIENNNSVSAERVELQLPFSGYFIATNVSDSIVQGTYSSRIKLGEIKPSEVVVVQVWTGSRWFGESSGEIKVVSPLGKSDVLVLRKMPLWFGWMFDDGHVVRAILFIELIGGLLFLGIVTVLTSVKKFFTP
jgi:hypothetical protein